MRNEGIRAAAYHPTSSTIQGRDTTRDTQSTKNICLFPGAPTLPCIECVNVPTWLGSQGWVFGLQKYYATITNLGSRGRRIH